MSRSRICGKRWPASLCAPGAEHECTRPVHPLTDRIGHPGQCCCKCGTWATVASAGNNYSVKLTEGTGS